MREILKALAPMRRRIENMIVRGITTALTTAKGMQRLNLRLLGGEAKQSVEYFEPYGFTGAPQNGAEALTIFLDGDRSHGIVICTADRRYRLQVAQGEVAMYDDQGQKVHLMRDGIVVDAVANPVTVKSTTMVRVESPVLQCTGDIIDNCDTNTQTMSVMRTIYNEHHHLPGTVTPTPEM